MIEPFISGRISSSVPNIQTIETKPVRFPLKRPFITAAGQKTETHNVQVCVRLENGICGFSEASSSIAMPKESQDNMQMALKHMIPELRGHPIENFKELVATAWRLETIHPTAAAAMECAILDAYTRSTKQSLAKFFGGKGTKVETDLTLSLGEPNDLFKQAKAAVKKGFKRLKIKVAGNVPALDAARLAAVHKAAPQATLVADGNQGFQLSQATEFVHLIRRAQVPIAFLEQPFPKHDLKSMRLLRQRLHISIYADEAVLSASDAARVFEAEAADGIIIKVAKSGLLGALDIIHLAQRFKKTLGIGCMEESKLGLAASVHLACGTGAFEWIDLDSVFLLNEPPSRGGFQMKGPQLSVAGIRAGIGI
jgi:L-Ala-D/L-Glu epimerase